MIERRFRSIKPEEIHLNEYRYPKELRSAIRRYVETYNTKRPHEALEYATPSEVFSAAFAMIPRATVCALCPSCPMCPFASFAMAC